MYQKVLLELYKVIMSFWLCLLTNAPTTFIDLMNRVFHEYLAEFIIVFVDGILIYSDNEELHERNLKLTLKC